MNGCPECGSDWASAGLFKRTFIRFSSVGGHNHDDNCITRAYVCANGHRRILSIRRVCPVGCGWKGKPRCSCHPDDKLDYWPGICDVETKPSRKVHPRVDSSEEGG